jgi:AmmeMemoRadiSam system protein A
MNTCKASTPITDEQGHRLVAIARRTIAAKLGILVDPDQVVSDQDCSEPAFQELRGTFVTLKIKGQLRGCMGCLTPSETILEGIQRNAINSAFRDPRFPQLTAAELNQTEIDIIILTSPCELEFSDASDLLQKISPNIDGLIIKKGTARATFLPQVWEQLPRPEDFLAHLCRKAGLAQDEWKKGELEVSTYQAQYFHEKR